jgi:hypothetical protein
MLLNYCDLMLRNPNPMAKQKDDIFEAFKFARPGFLKIALDKSAKTYKWVLSKLHSSIAPHGQTKTIQSYNVVNVFSQI